jgi:sphingolipid delta-4 desaturase
MTPSASTATTLSTNGKGSAVNGKGSTAIAPRHGVASEEEEAIEAKYRDFFWTYTEEPHRTRRLAIIKAHPEVGAVEYCPIILSID